MSDTTTTTRNLFELAAATPEHMEHGVRASRNLENLPEKERVQHVVIIGMGGSGIAGDVVVATAAPFMSVPVTVVKSYELPAFVGEGSLVFAISVSGNTEETLEAASDAAVQGARVVVVSSGGQLVELAGSWGAPTVRVPRNIPYARAGLGAIVAPPLTVLEEIGLFPGASQWVDLAVEQLKQRRDQLVQPGNAAEQLAQRLLGKVALVYGGGAVGAAAAQRWKSQINANAKAPAFWAAQPELCHNELLGWESLSETTRKDLAIVSLRHDDEHPQVTRRFELVHEYVRDRVAAVEEVTAEGDGDLAQLLDLMLVGDYVSLHLADLAGVDAGPTEFLTRLKTALSER